MRVCVCVCVCVGVYECCVLQQVQKALQRGKDVLFLHDNISSSKGSRRDISFVPRQVGISVCLIMFVSLRVCVCVCVCVCMCVLFMRISVHVHMS